MCSSALERKYCLHEFPHTGEDMFMQINLACVTSVLHYCCSSAINLYKACPKEQHRNECAIQHCTRSVTVIPLWETMQSLHKIQASSLSSLCVNLIFSFLFFRLIQTSRFQVSRQATKVLYIHSLPSESDM